MRPTMDFLENQAKHRPAYTYMMCMDTETYNNKTRERETEEKEKAKKQRSNEQRITRRRNKGDVNMATLKPFGPWFDVEMLFV